MSPGVTTRADLHVHSRHSDQARIRGLRALGGQECYTEPSEVYALARARGMDFVTISDHNSLDGALAIAHLPGTFLSAEFDTWFPENGCRVHVVASRIDERTFAEAVKARESVYDLVACLREASVLHFLAHPLFDMTGKLTPDIVEKCLLLFNVLEARNGARTVRCNGLLREVAAGLTPQRIEAMAERQGLAPYGATPWHKSLVGGSDDHSGLFVAGAHTAAEGHVTLDGFLGAVTDGDCSPGGEDGDARLLAHTIYAGSFWRIREIMRLDGPPEERRALDLLRKGFGRIGRDVPVLEKTVRGVRSMAPGLYRDADPRGPAWEALLDERLGSLAPAPDGIASLGSTELNARLWDVASRLADEVQALHLEQLLTPGRRTLKRLSLSSFGVGMVQFLELPYYLAWHLQTRDRDAQALLRAQFVDASQAPAQHPDPSLAPLRVAVLADASPQEDGAGFDLSWLRSGAPGIEPGQPREPAVEILTLAAHVPPGRASVDGPAAPEGHWPAGVDAGSSTCLTLGALVARRIRGKDVLLPPLLDVLDHLDERGVDAIHVTGPGPMGLAGLAAARLLHVPVGGACGAAHAHAMTRVSRLSPADRARARYLRWFYGRLDALVAPSRSVARRLADAGFDPVRIHVGAVPPRDSAPRRSPVSAPAPPPGAGTV